MEATKGPAARAKAPSDRNVPRTAPRDSSGECEAAIVVIQETANAVATNQFFALLPVPISKIRTVIATSRRFNDSLPKYAKLLYNYYDLLPSEGWLPS